jgi:hypothetical protein
MIEAGVMDKRLDSASGQKDRGNVAERQMQNQSKTSGDFVR